MDVDRPEDLLRLAVDLRAEWTLVRVSGELCYTTERRLRECVDQLMESELFRIAFDLPALAFCDSVGIACFVSAWRRVRAAGGDAVLLRPPDWLRRRLDLTGVDRVVSVVDELPHAEPSGGAADLAPA